MRRHLVLVAVGIAAGASLGGYALAGSGSASSTARHGCSGWFPGPPPAPRGPARDRLGYRARACLEAAGLLSRVILPSSATPTAGEPAGDRGALRRPAFSMAGMRLVDLHRFWTVPEPEPAVYGFLLAHTPARAKRDYGMPSQPGQSGLIEAATSYVFAPGPGYVPLRQLLVMVTALPAGGSAVRVDAQAQEIIPRPTAERIPGRAEALEFTIGVPGRPPLVSRTVTNRAIVRRISAMINRLPIVQPEAINSPAYAPHPSIATLTFLSQPHGAVLARAGEMAGAVEPTTPCDPMSLEVEGHHWKPLLGGAEVVERAERMLGLTRAPGREVP